MQLKEVLDINIGAKYPLPTPEEIRKEVPASAASLQTVLAARETLRNILDSKDKRIFVVVGPCSIHDVKSAMEYAGRLKSLSDKVADQIVIVMRVYFEKPRTTIGWKGLINDPLMDDSFQIEKGLKLARKLLIDISSMGLPTATEALDPITPQYLSELISWSAIGARTTESQTHRELASGLSMPVGFKNGTDGNIQIAINAMESALTPHHFLGIDSKGKISVFMTKGNAYSHVVLRGGSKGPNYSAEHIAEAETALERHKLQRKIMVDCSHGNSNKDYKNQPKVFRAILDQIVSGNQTLCGMMLESHLFEGSQKIPTDPKDLRYGVSVTDACIGWDTTEALLLEAHKKLSRRAA